MENKTIKMLYHFIINLSGLNMSKKLKIVLIIILNKKIITIMNKVLKIIIIMIRLIIIIMKIIIIVQ